MKTETFRRKLEALEQEAMKEEAAVALGNEALDWAWWVVVDALDAALSAVQVMERMSVEK